MVLSRHIVDLGLAPVYWQTHPHLRTFVQFCHETQGPPREPDPLDDTQQAQPSADFPRLDDIKALTVVGDRELEVVVGAEQSDLSLAGIRVFHDVVQRFLSDPVQTEGRLGIE